MMIPVLLLLPPPAPRRPGRRLTSETEWTACSYSCQPRLPLPAMPIAMQAHAQNAHGSPTHLAAPAVGVRAKVEAKETRPEPGSC